MSTTTAPTPVPPTSPRRPHRRSHLLVAVVAVAVVAALGGLYFLGFLGGGSVQLMVHDAPCSGCAHVWVTFSSISVHESDVKGSGWTTLQVTGTTFDLEALNSSSMAKVLGLDALAAGHYEQIQVSVVNVTIGLTSGAQVKAVVEGPSADFNGQFDVSTGGTTTLNIDIDLAASIHLTPAPLGPVSATFTPDIGAVVVSGS